MKLVLKLASNENYFTEELVGILWNEFKLFISNWNRFDLYLPLLKPRKIELVFLMKANPSANLALKLDLGLEQRRNHFSVSEKAATISLFVKS